MKKRLVCYTIIIVLLAATLPFAKKPGAFADTGTNGLASNIVVSNVTAAEGFIEQGFEANITASVENLATTTETFGLTFYADGIALNTQELTLSGQNSTTASYLWDTTNFPFGNVTLSVSAWDDSDQTSAIYSNSTGNSILVTYPDDLLGHGTVNFADIQYFVHEFINYYASNGSPLDPTIDFNHDGKLNFADIQIFVKNYIAYWTGPTPFLNGGLTLNMSIPQTSFIQGEPVNFTLSVNNYSNHTISFDAPYGFFDYIVYNDTGIVYRSSLNILMSPQYILLVTLPPGGNYSQNMQWDQTCNLSLKLSMPVFPAQPGTYYIIGQALGMQTIPQQITITT